MNDILIFFLSNKLYALHPPRAESAGPALLCQGAEGKLFLTEWLGRPAVCKNRWGKGDKRGGSRRKSWVEKGEKKKRNIFSWEKTLSIKKAPNRCLF